ncbi:MAG: Si-specific NAD(P)(+) transhydrogenase [Terriglobales bacterium]
MSTHNCDLVVIGGGPAGQKGALAAAKLRKKVAVVERKWSGPGPSAQAGTISSRLLREAVLALRARRLFQGNDPAQPRIEMSELAARVPAIVNSYAAILKSQLQGAEVETIAGEARFVDSRTVEIQTDQGPTRVTAEKFLIAVGTRPAASQHVVIDGLRIFNSDQLLSMRRIPRHLIIVGAGLIGVEYASMLVLLGAKVTLVDERPALLAFVDRQIVDALRSHLTQLGVSFRLGVKVVECKSDAAKDRVTVQLSNGETIEGESLLYVAGRQANTDTLNLAALGVRTTEDGKIEVNDQFQTAVPGIYAAGDVIGFAFEGLYYASISMEQARLAVCNMYGFPAGSSPEVFPYAIYGIPEIAMVGATEQALEESKIEYQTGVARYEELVQAQISDEHGFLKLLFDPESLKLLGVHIMGVRAAEVIHIGQAVLRFGGTIEYFRDAIFNYPTIAEAYKLAAADGLRKVGWLP